MLDRLKKPEPALLQFDAALKIDSFSKMARFRKAQILLKLGAFPTWTVLQETA
jgi:anaphase-promoting complex subunit 3